MDPKNISFITIAPTGNWKYASPGVLSIHSKQFSGPENKIGIQYWAIDRYNPSADPAFSYFQEATSYQIDTVPPGIDNYANDDYIIVVTTQGLNNTQVPQGALYQFLIKIGAGPQLEMLEQVNTFYACGFTGKIAYTLITTPGTVEQGLEFGIIPQSVYVTNNNGGNQEQYYGSTVYPGATLIAQLVPTTFDNKTIYTPVLTSNQAV
ncbi:hypothetical protein [Rubritalea tangerina]|uniref:Uncharacterized protein n=1 Tax=Rubritalea tangerina TaxID=430798 RepID=A0ABW4ZBZ6_9BACT